MGFFSRLFCCSRNALSDVDDMEKPYNNFNFKNVKSRNYFEHVKQSKGILFKSSCFYRGWVDSLITGCPTVINPKNDEQRVSFRGQVDGFNSGIKGLILLSMEAMENVPLVAEVFIGNACSNSVFIFVKEKYFYEGEEERLEYLSRLIHIKV